MHKGVIHIDHPMMSAYQGIPRCSHCQLSLKEPSAEQSLHHSKRSQASPRSHTPPSLQPQLPSRYRRPLPKRQRQPAPYQAQASKRRHRPQDPQLRVQNQCIDAPAEHGHAGRKETRRQGVISRNKQSDRVSELKQNKEKSISSQYTFLLKKKKREERERENKIRYCAEKRKKKKKNHPPDNAQQSTSSPALHL